MKIFKSCGIVFLFIASSILFSCGGGGSGTGDLGGVGTVSMSLTDAMSNQFKAVCVTINEVQVHTKGSGNGNNGWVNVSTPNLPKTFNLYELTNGVREQIGLADLESGDYTQMRLLLGTKPDDGINILSEAHPYANYVIDTDDNYQELKIPSGIQSGFKIIHGFTISPKQTTELTYDFLVEKSVIVGSDGNWHLHPTIKVDDSVESSIIRGWVTSDGINGIGGALVSVQKYNGSAGDPKDQVVIQASTITDEEGHFSIIVTPLDEGQNYNLVVYAEGKEPVLKKINTLNSGETITFFDSQKIQLGVDVITNILTDVVPITGQEYSEQFASLSFRQSIVHDNKTEMIEVTSVNVLNGMEYSINLPLGSYLVVAWSSGFDTRTANLSVLESGASFDEQEPPLSLY